MGKILDILRGPSLAQLFLKDRLRQVDAECEMILRVEKLAGQLSDLRRAVDRLSERGRRGR